MKLKLSIVFVGLFLAISCADNTTTVVNNYFYDLDGRKANLDPKDSLEVGATYLNIYSQVYQFTSQRKFDLTTTVSMSNTSKDDRIYIEKIDFFNTKGELIRSFITNPIFVEPLETVEIVINETDNTGGSGGKFYFTWHKPNDCPDPFFESVMISTTGQQGLSLISHGVRVK